MARLNRIELQKADGLYDGLVRIERSGDDLVLADAATPAGASLTNLLNSVSQEDVEDIVAGLLVAGANIALTYDDATGSLTIASTAAGNADIGARVYNSAAIPIPNNTVVDLTFNSERWDTGGLHDPALNPARFTIQEAGKYLVTAHVGWTGNATGRRWLSITLNGATRLAIDNMYPTDSATSYQSVSTIYDFAAGDYLVADVYQTSGTTLDVVAIDGRSPEFAIQKIA